MGIQSVCLYSTVHLAAGGGAPSHSHSCIASTFLPTAAEHSTSISCLHVALGWLFNHSSNISRQHSRTRPRPSLSIICRVPLGMPSCRPMACHLTPASGHTLSINSGNSGFLIVASEKKMNVTKEEYSQNHQRKKVLRPLLGFPKTFTVHGKVECLVYCFSPTECPDDSVTLAALKIF